MSNEAINWALDQPVSKSSAKFVLVAMANLAGADMTCWPSMQYLVNATSQDRKTVLEGMKRLRQAGFLVDTGARKGATKSVVVYRLSQPENGTALKKEEADQVAGIEGGSGAENGATPNSEAVPNFPISSPVFPTKQSQISHEAVPKTGHRTIKEPSRTPKDTSDVVRPEVSLLADVDQQLVADYLQVRKAKKAGPLTATAISGLRREAGKAGISCAEAVQACCEFGWQGFNAGWYAQRVGSASASSKPTGKHTGFQTKNYREGVSEDGSFV